MWSTPVEYPRSRMAARRQQARADDALSGRRNAARVRQCSIGTAPLTAAETWRELRVARSNSR